MKILGCLFIFVFTQTIFAQEFEGIYAGDLFSKNNVISLKVKGNAVTGALFTNPKDKHDLHGQVNGSELTGTLDYPPGIWMIKAVLISDSLNVTVSTGPDSKQALFVRISRNPIKNIEKTMESLSRDQRLVGTWELKKVENFDGSLKAIDERAAGMTWIFSSDGTCFANFPSQSKMFNSAHFSPPQKNWSTIDSRLTISDSNVTGTVVYEIRGDTLIRVIAVTKEFYLKKK